MSGARRYLSRPRTKLYDCNYTMGERMYRNVVDSLDKPRSARVAAEPPSFERVAPSSRATRGRSADAYEEDDSILKIRAARAKMEEEVRAFEEASNARRAAIKSQNSRVDLSDRLMDSVGLVRRSAENGDYTYSSSVSNGRRAHAEFEDDSYFQKKALNQKLQLDEEDEVPRPGRARARFLQESPDQDAAAALERAKKSRARLAEIENEMDELNEKSKARSARIAAARDVLREAAECDSDVTATKSVRISKRAIQVTERVG